MNDAMANGTIQALKSRNLAGKVFVSGNDAETPTLKLIKNGEQTMSVYTDIDDFGSSAVKAAIDLSNKGAAARENGRPGRRGSPHAYRSHRGGNQGQPLRGCKEDGEGLDDGVGGVRRPE